LFDSRGRSKSNFLRDVENLETEIDYNDKDIILMANKASEPLDILWKNMGIIRGHFSFIRFFLFIVSIAVILFLSSPTVMVTRLQNID